MAIDVAVLVDTCTWVPFFNQPNSPEKRAVDGLLDDDRAVPIGPIVAEILIGFRRGDHADWVASSLRGHRVLHVKPEDWRSSARIGRRLAAQGHAIPLTDLAIAAVSLSRGAQIFTSDPHFNLILELHRDRP
jgi:predicted nucleic acid-binding protein